MYDGMLQFIQMPLPKCEPNGGTATVILRMTLLDYKLSFGTARTPIAAFTPTSVQTSP
jgi:hypothetical protein